MLQSSEFIEMHGIERTSIFRDSIAFQTEIQIHLDIQGWRKPQDIGVAGPSMSLEYWCGR